MEIFNNNGFSCTNRCFHARSIEDWDFLMWCLCFCICIEVREKPPNLDASSKQSLDLFIFFMLKIVRSDLWNIVITRFLLSIFRLHLDPIAHQQHMSMQAIALTSLHVFGKDRQKYLSQSNLIRMLSGCQCMHACGSYFGMSQSLTLSLSPSHVCYSCRSNKTLDFKSYTRKCF